MRRREFITLLGGTAAAWPVAEAIDHFEIPPFRIIEIVHAFQEADKIRC